MHRMHRIRFTKYRCIFLLLLLFMVKCCLDLQKDRPDSNSLSFINLYDVGTTETLTYEDVAPENYYKYPLVNGMRVAMDYELNYNSSYFWFMAMQSQFKNIGLTQNYTIELPKCKLWGLNFGPIKVNKSKVNMEQVEKDHNQVLPGGYYAPPYCRARQRVAIIVPYRNRPVNLGIFLHYIHSFLKIQQLEYRIFVIEQFGSDKFNKGTLYNIAFLESQRFGSWDCLVFHDLDLVPEDERIAYTCSKYPTHLASAVESLNYSLPYPSLISGAIALTPKLYREVNGFSNLYWGWGGEDDDFYNRIEKQNISVYRYKSPFVRYASLPHKRHTDMIQGKLLLMISKKMSQREGLTTTNYRLVSVVKEKLYTHIVADVNPSRMKLNIKSLMRKVFELYGKKIIFGIEEFRLAYPQRRKITNIY